jgi:REP element-mobilizing transposase RayT
VANSFIEFAERAYSEHNIAVGRYVIMPDHIHLFVTGPDDFELGRWMSLLKQFFAKRIVHPKTAGPVWQRDSSIISCAAKGVTDRSGIMCVTIRCAPDLWQKPTIGHTPAK